MASIAAGVIVMNLNWAVCMKSMLVKLGNWEPSDYFLKTEVTEKTSINVADHRTLRNQTDFSPVVRQTKDCVLLSSLIFQCYVCIASLLKTRYTDSNSAVVCRRLQLKLDGTW